jgi:hypothetical protein
VGQLAAATAELWQYQQQQQIATSSVAMVCRIT